MTSRTIAVVSAGLRVPSSTRLLADQLATAVAQAAPTEAPVAIEFVELRDHAHAIADAMLTGFPSGALASAITTVVEADGVIVVTPTFGASFSGLFKSFIDVIEQDALRDKPILLAATGGTERHSLVLEFALRPLFSYLKARPVGTAVYAATADFGGAATAALAERIERAAAELVAALPAPVASVSVSSAPTAGLSADAAASVAGADVASASSVTDASAVPVDEDALDTAPAIAPVRGEIDLGADFVPFDQLLRQVGQGSGTDLEVEAQSLYDRFRQAERDVEERRFIEAARSLEALVSEAEAEGGAAGLTDARLLLARAYFGSAQLAKAAAAAERVLSDDPTDAYATLLLGRALERQRRHEEAAPVLTRARALGAH